MPPYPRGPDAGRCVGTVRESGDWRSVELDGQSVVKRRYCIKNYDASNSSQLCDKRARCFFV